MSDFDTIRARLQRGYHEGGHHPRCTTLADEGCDCYARGTVDARAALSRIEAAAEQAEKALEPFGTGAQAFDRTESTYGDGPVFARWTSESSWRFTVSDVRRAAAALSLLRDEDTEEGAA